MCITAREKGKVHCTTVAGEEPGVRVFVVESEGVRSNSRLDLLIVYFGPA